MQKTIIVCDECGEPGRRVRVKTDSKTLEKDLCREHERTAFAGWRRARRGRAVASA